MAKVDENAELAELPLNDKLTKEIEGLDAAILALE